MLPCIPYLNKGYLILYDVPFIWNISPCTKESSPGSCCSWLKWVRIKNESPASWLDMIRSKSVKHKYTYSFCLVLHTYNTWHSEQKTHVHSCSTLVDGHSTLVHIHSTLVHSHSTFTLIYVWRQELNVLCHIMAKCLYKDIVLKKSFIENYWNLVHTGFIVVLYSTADLMKNLLTFVRFVKLKKGR